MRHGYFNMYSPGNHAGAKRGCIFYSLACTCRNLGINFFEYPSDVLNKSAVLQPGATANAYRNLLPDKWAKDEQTPKKAKYHQYFARRHINPPDQAT